MKRLLLPLLLILAGCETTVNIDLPTPDSQLVVNSLFTSRDSVWAVRLSRSVGIQSEARLDEVDSALVVLLQNGTPVDTLVRSSEGPADSSAREETALYVSDEGLRPKAGRSYGLQATAPGFDAVEATSRVPEPVSFTAATGQLAYLNEPVIQVTFTDPASQSNYYGISLQRKDQEGDVEDAPVNLPFLAVDSLLQDGVFLGAEFDDDGPPGFEHAYFTDEGIGGEQYTLAIWPQLPDSLSAQGTYLVRFYTLSAGYYEYVKTLATYSQSNNNPFAEPAQLFSNVTGGLGIFAGAGVAVREVRLSAWELNKHSSTKHESL